MIYELWDVFTTESFAGNPLAVIPDATGLSEAQMQRVANEFNLSETSFVLPPETAVPTERVRARYFTPSRELPMAGHPSVGTVFALEKSGPEKPGLFTGRDVVTLELNIGPVEMALERTGGVLTRVWMNQGVPQLLETFDPADIAPALGLAESDLEPDLPVQLGSAGNPFLLVPLVSTEALARVRVDPALLLRQLPGDFQAVLAFTQNAPASDVRARMFSVARSVDEDPATGSAHGPLGAYLALYTDLLQAGGGAFVSHQGVEMGRPSELFVRVTRPDTGTQVGVQVEVGGAAVQVGRGELFV